MTRDFMAAPLAVREVPTSHPQAERRRRETCASRGGFLVSSGAEESQHCEYAPRLAAGGGQPELPEDARDVLLDRPDGDHELVGDPLVRAPGSHQLEHLALARGQPDERVVRALAGDEGLDDDPGERRT